VRSSFPPLCNTFGTCPLHHTSDPSNT
jgi:hypothetical protein